MANDKEVSAYLEKLDRLGIKPGLVRIKKLLSALGNPEKRLKVIHIVGTNGKSSTARMVGAILGAHGLKAGVYISPHLVSFCERYVINSKEITEQRFEKLIMEVKEKADEVDRRAKSSGPLTQFEVLTAAAFRYFHQQKVDVAVIEAGLGGRYDATNVTKTRVQVLTNVELEHTDLLGDTITAIVREKTAVIPDKGTVVLGNLSEEALKEARRICARKKAKTTTLGEEFSLLKGRGEKFDVWTAKGQYPDLSLNLLGQHQRTNCAIAVQTAE
ncbi:MAG: Mur ligase family protein, partial [Actinomycetota bacterium]